MIGRWFGLGRQELEAKCADLTTQLTAAESTVAQLQSLVPELDAAKEHVEALTTQVKQLEEQLAESKQQLEDAEMERKTVERKHAGVVGELGPRATAAWPAAPPSVAPV